MNDQDRPKSELLDELAQLRQKIQSLEIVEKKYTALKEKIRHLGELVNDPQYAAPSVPHQEARDCNATLMVVDDNEVFREVVVTTLTLSGYRVLEAGNLSEAMQVLRDSPISVDLILTDVVMPEGSGNELSRNIKEQYPNIKMLFMSGYSDELLVHSEVQKAMESKDSFLQKPFLTEDLITKIREKLGRENP
jgi:CheY-like chemotaxis protein